MTDGVVLLTDFRAPNLHEVSQVCERVVEIKINRVNEQIIFIVGAEEWEIQRVLATPGPVALSGRFEMDQVERFVLSPQFTRLVAEIASSRPVTILTEPRGLGACAFLAAANANIGPIFG